MEQNLFISHKNLDLIVVITDYDYWPEEKPSRDSPGEPEGVCINKGYLLLDKKPSILIKSIEEQLKESGRLFDWILEHNSDYLHEMLLESIRNERENAKIYVDVLNYYEETGKDWYDH